MSKLDINSYTPQPSDRFPLDTNILINQFYPLMGQNYMIPYQQFYVKAIKQKSVFLLPAIQISEFINRCIRFSFDFYKKTNSLQNYDYKHDYRESNDYREHMTAILDIVKNDIIPTFTIVDDHFSEMSQDKIYVYGFSYDFNDALLVQIAEKQHASIVTHDADFANYTTKVNMISSNQRLLMFH